jgi:hypothetical protein
MGRLRVFADRCEKLERNGNVLFEGKHPALIVRAKELHQV